MNDEDHPMGYGAQAKANYLELRDRFAAEALKALLGSPNFQWELAKSYSPEENVARRAYAVADAMMWARKSIPS